MQKKISLLILASIIGLVALCLVQGYLIHNSFQLKQEAFWDVATSYPSRVEDHPATKETALRKALMELERARQRVAKAQRAVNGGQ